MNEKYELMNDKNECSFLENEADDECLSCEDGTLRGSSLDVSSRVEAIELLSNSIHIGGCI